MVFGFSFLPQVFALISLIFNVKQISLLDLVKSDEKEEAVKLVKKIYKLSDDTCTAEEWIEHLKTQINYSENYVPLSTSLFSP